MNDPPPPSTRHLMDRLETALSDLRARVTDETVADQAAARARHRRMDAERDVARARQALDQAIDAIRPPTVDASRAPTAMPAPR